MTEFWKRVFKNNIDCYRSIQILAERGIIDEEEKAVFEHNLLYDIIDTMGCELTPDGKWQEEEILLDQEGEE